MKWFVRTSYQITWWQLLVGPAHLVDAIVNLLTFGFVSPGASVRISKQILKHGLAKQKGEGLNAVTGHD